MTKEQRQTIREFLEWFGSTALDHIPNAVYQGEGRELYERVSHIVDHETCPCKECQRR